MSDPIPFGTAFAVGRVTAWGASAEVDGRRRVGEVRLVLGAAEWAAAPGAKERLDYSPATFSFCDVVLQFIWASAQPVK